MQLDNRQATFADALLNPDLPVPDGIVDPVGQPAPKRFSVYRNNVMVSLVDAMATSFPIIQKIVGEEFFAAMARAFVAAHPPTSPLLMFYGDAFPGFLKSFQPVSQLDYLPEVALLEQYRREAYHAADVRPLPPDFLGGVAQDQLGSLCLMFHPSLRVLNGEHPALSIWEWNQAEDEIDKQAIPDHGEAILVSRPEMSVETRRLPPGCYQFITALADGKTLDAAAQMAASEPAFDLAKSISVLLETRITTDFKIDGANK